jgi:hypothetical protein
LSHFAAFYLVLHRFAAFCRALPRLTAFCRVFSAISAHESRRLSQLNVKDYQRIEPEDKPRPFFSPPITHSLQIYENFKPSLGK